MKRLHLCFLALASIMLASCGGHSPLKLSEDEILKKVNHDLVETGSDSATVTIQTGYYEQNDESVRLLLEKLEAAGVVNYDVERFAWWEKKREEKTYYKTVTRYYGWYSYPETVKSTKWVTSYVYNEHFMVNVSLTEAAQKYALNHRPLPKLKEEEDKDLKQPVFDYSQYPESQIVSLSENWPEVPHPLAEQTYQKCKAILGEVRTMLDQTTDNSYSKAEQKLSSLYRVDNFDCMTQAQTAEINMEAEELARRINEMKGNEAFAKSKAIIEEATTMVNNAKVCKDVDKADNKMNGINYVSNADKMSGAQSSEISSLVQTYNTLADKKREELGCNTVEETAVYEEEEPEEIVDERNPQAIAYDKVKDNEPIPAILFAYINKAVAARDINIGQSERGTTASAQVIFKISKVTDAARVLLRVIDDKRYKDDVMFNYYSDKGWVIEDHPNPHLEY